MSSNLVKQRYMVVPEEEERRVIDSNSRMRERLAKMRESMLAAGEGGFVSGIAAETVELLLDETGTDKNVIKAGEDSGTLLEQARTDAGNILNEAQAEAARIVADAKAQAEQEKARVMQQAEKRGYDDGMAKAMAKERALEQEYNRRMQELEAFYTQQIDTLEPQFIDTITAVYEHIFHTDFSGYQDVLLHLVGTTIRKAEGSRNFLIHVSKDDYIYVNEHKEQLLENLSDSWKADVIEDAVLGVGQCMIETENGIYDCGLDTQLEGLKKKLMLLAWSKEE